MNDKIRVGLRGARSKGVSDVKIDIPLSPAQQRAREEEAEAKRKAEAELEQTIAARVARDKRAAAEAAGMLNKAFSAAATSAGEASQALVSAVSSIGSAVASNYSLEARGNPNNYLARNSEISGNLLVTGTLNSPSAHFQINTNDGASATRALQIAVGESLLTWRAELPRNVRPQSVRRGNTISIHTSTMRTLRGGVEIPYQFDRINSEREMVEDAAASLTARLRESASEDTSYSMQVYHTEVHVEVERDIRNLSHNIFAEAPHITVVLQGVSDPYSLMELALAQRQQRRYAPRYVTSILELDEEIVFDLSPFRFHMIELHQRTSPNNKFLYLLDANGNQRASRTCIRADTDRVRGELFRMAEGIRRSST